MPKKMKSDEIKTSEEKTDPEIPVAKDPPKSEPLRVKLNVEVEPAKVIPLERQILCQEYVRGKGALGSAFLAEQKLLGRPKKHGRSEWDKLYRAWITRPRP